MKQATKQLVMPFVLALAVCHVAAPGLPWSAVAEAAAPAESEAARKGREALSNVARFPWYDRSADKARPLHVVPRHQSDSENRGSVWTHKDRSVAPTTFGGPRVSLFGPVLQWVGMTLLVLLLGLIAFALARTFLREELTETASTRKVLQSAGSIDRVEALPVKLRGAAEDFLELARRNYEAGNYSEAILYLFSHQLVALDTHRAIRLAKGKTNRQYLRELRRHLPLRNILEGSMVAFEDVFFGKKTLSRERFENCWSQLALFDRELDAQGAAR